MFIEIRAMFIEIISTGVKCRLILLHNQSKTIMKTKIIISALLILALLPGCFIKSIHPFYTDKDLVYKEELLGKWTGKDDSNWEISRHMRKAGLAKADIPDKAYDIAYSDEKGTSRFIAHLFQLDKQLYIDFYPAEDAGHTDLEGFHFVQAHSLAQASISNNVVTIKWYNEEWLMTLFNQNKVRIAHERTPYDLDDKDPDHQQVILTANTADLQKFIRKYGQDPEAFGTDKNKSDYTMILTRQKASNKK